MQVETDIDITSESSVADLRDHPQGTAIDVLINNAGILKRITLESLDFDSIWEQFEVNALRALQVTHAFLPNLRADAKVVLMTSRMGSIGDNTSGGSYGYRMSKVALAMAGKSLAHDLRAQSIAVASLHPGLVQTRMIGFPANGITLAASVKGLLTRIDALTLEHTGTFSHSNGEVLPW